MAPGTLNAGAGCLFFKASGDSQGFVLNYLDLVDVGPADCGVPYWWGVEYDWFYVSIVGEYEGLLVLDP